MNSSLSIFHKGLLLIGIPVAAQVVFLIILQLARADQDRAQAHALHTKDVIVKAETSHRLLFETNGYMRFFVLSSGEIFRKNYWATRDRILPNYKALAEMVEDNDGQSRKVVEIQEKVGEFIDWMDENVRLVENKKADQATIRIQNYTGLGYLEAVRTATDDFLEREEALDRVRLQTLRESTRWQSVVLLLGILLALGTAGGLLIVFSRGIARRIDVLTRNTRLMAEGKTLAPRLDGRDELSTLDALFHDMADTVRHKDQENEMFVYSVSHDLRSPLVNLQGFSKELSEVLLDLRRLLHETALPDRTKEQVARLLDRDAAESIQFIQTAVTRLAGIIDALLRLSRVGRVEYQLQNVEMQDVVKQVARSLHDTAVRQGASVVVQSLPPARGDPTALDQVFGNLLSNALNYLDPARPGKIEVGALEKADDAPEMNVYYVKDNGFGIPEAFQEKVFVAFQRLNPNAVPGEGIGLALVRRVIERHGGKVWLESKPGEGSTFYVALPPGRP